MSGFSFGTPSTTTSTLPAFGAQSTPTMSFGTGQANPANMSLGTPKTGGFNFGSSTPATQSSGFSLPTVQPQPSSGFSFGTPTATVQPQPQQPQPSTGISFGTQQQQPSTGISFGAQQPSTGISFGTQQPSTGISFGAQQTSTTQPLSLSTSASQAQPTGFSFGQSSTATSTTSSLPAASLSLGVTPLTQQSQPQQPSTGLTFGLPSTQTTSVTSSAPTLSFGSATPATTTGLNLTLNPTKTATAGISFGLAQPQPQQQQPSTQSSFFGMSQPQQPQQQLSLLPTQSTPATSTIVQQNVGLGGIDMNATQPKATEGKSESTKVKETQVPKEIIQTVDDFKTYLKLQKTLSAEIVRTTDRKLKSVSSEIQRLNCVVQDAAINVDNNKLAIKLLRSDTSKIIQHADMAQRTHETPSGLQFENIMPQIYFNELIHKYEHDLLTLKHQVELTEKHLQSLSNPQNFSAQDLKRGLQQIHESFIALAGRLQETHTKVETQKEQHLNLRKFLLRDNKNVFEESQEKQNSSSLNTSKVQFGPNPFSNSHHGLNFSNQSGRQWTGNQQTVTNPSWPTNQTANSMSFFGVKNSSVSRYEHSRLKFLGSFGESYHEDDEIRITTNERNEIVDILVHDLDKKCRQEILIIHYDKERFLKCYDELYNPVASEENFAIFIAKALKTEQEKTNEGNFFDYLSEQTHNFLIAFSSLSAKVLNPIFQVFNRTVTYQHCSNWRSCLNDGQSRNGFIVLDVLLGILVFLLMNHIQHTGKYFMDLTELIVNRLRILLEMLDGSPAGLKLNVQLNNFLLSCFMYHVELWWNFIVIVEPAVHYLFLPITIFGLMGFSFQCAMLCDVITLITLHAHCFYIYAAMLFKLELYSIRSLLRIVLGRRLNVLKNRVESQTYTNRQLFLATLFFTTLLFLLPTIIIYYLVFASKASQMASGINVQFEELSYKVKCGTINKIDKTILNGINGEFRGNELSVIMGPSGCGKTSLLNVLTGFVNEGIEGTLRINGSKSMFKSIRNQSAYIMQDQTLYSLLTVHESMMFAIKFKTGKAMNTKDQINKCNETLKRLGLFNQSQLYVKNLSGGQQKRLSIAIEIVDDPKILFLDEPTTGLDSSSSTQCLSLLKQLSQEGKTIICTIHAPSALMFEKFDHIYVLAEGSCIYQGSSRNVVPFLTSLDLICPESYNPADYVLEISTNDYGFHNQRLTKCIQNGLNEEFRNQTKDDQIKNYLELLPTKKKSKYSATFFYQFSLLLQRNFTLIRRDKSNVIMRFMVSFIMAVFCGCFFFSVGQSATRIFDNFKYIYVSSQFLTYSAYYSIMVKFPLDLPILRREHFNRWYATGSYYLALSIGDSPVSIIYVLIYYGVSYIMTGQPLEFHRVTLVISVCIINSFVAQAYGMLAGSLGGLMKTLIIAMFIMVLHITFAGVLVLEKDAIPPMSWFFDYDFLKHTNDVLLFAAFGWNRKRLDCIDEFYCHFEKPEKFLKMIGTPKNPISNFFTIFPIVFIIVHLLTFFNMNRLIKRSK
ncbi:CLUMA_CG007974, isoform A [Clunio marinus]|uniref:CLUMA_CG007974, isoform A n=1 Tax=Clunio marinus TaxID=568069 RepID=A0A1J1I4F6_9DIPT|nr:CLUMA_CG007974, isoform A [Clunio marinus]